MGDITQEREDLTLIGKMYYIRLNLSWQSKMNIQAKQVTEYWIKSLLSASVMLFVRMQYHDHLRVLSANFLCVDFSQDFLREKKLKILGCNLKGHF